MIRRITARKAGGSVTATLPKELVERLSIQPGDPLFLVETERGILITPYDPDFDDAVQAFEEIRRRYRNALRKLAE